jgi:hypothetical protein
METDDPGAPMKRRAPLAVRILRRLLAPLAIVAIAVALGGCGGTATSSQDPCVVHGAKSHACKVSVEAELKAHAPEIAEREAKQAATEAKIKAMEKTVETPIEQEEEAKEHAVAVVGARIAREEHEDTEAEGK